MEFFDLMGFVFLKIDIDKNSGCSVEIGLFRVIKL